MDERERFRVGCFNLYNLVGRGKRAYGHDPLEGELYDAKIAWTARQLGDMRADIVGFQEVFDQGALEEALAADPYTSGHHVCADGMSGQHPEVALATRYPVHSFERIELFPDDGVLELDDAVTVPRDRFTHAVLRAHVQVAKGLDVHVFVVHLKSKRPKFLSGEDRFDPSTYAAGKARSLIIRAAEAFAVRQLVLEVMKGTKTPVIVIGDLNDADVAVTTEIVAGDPPPRRWKRGEKKQAWDVLLYNTKAIQARQSYRDVYYTHIHNGQYESLDHILVSEEFFRQNRAAPAFVEYVSVLNDHLIDETITAEEQAVWRSDHGQVVATFCIR